MKNVCLIILIISTLILSTSCDLMETTVIGTTVPESSADTQNEREKVSKEDDRTVKKILREFFTVLFTKASVDEYNENSRTGTIPEKIRGFIADKTLNEGDGNPEVGIHLPRYISINGMTIIGYNIENITGESEAENANIIADFISKDGDNFLYFTKIYAKAEVVPNEIFSKAYRKEEDNTYTKLREVNSDDIDLMRVEIRYDVELTKSDVGFSILRAIESNIKAGKKNRLFVFNNESITRLPYLDLSKTEDGSAYRNPTDGEIYESEKALISEFFQKFTLLDRERMNLISYKWKQGFNEVKEFWDTLGITTGEGDVKLIELDSQYNENYPFDSLPLRNNMEMIKQIDNFVVKPHPAYSEKIKLYYVNFDAVVQRTNGITDEDFPYRYDYLVSLLKTEDSLIIEKFKLNEYYTIPK